MRKIETTKVYIARLRREIDSLRLGLHLWTYDETLNKLERNIKKIRKLLQEYKQ